MLAKEINNMANFSFSTTNLQAYYKRCYDKAIKISLTKDEKTGYTYITADLVSKDYYHPAVGNFNFICDYANCGVLHLSKIYLPYVERTEDLAHLIDALAMILDRRIITYNSSSDQLNMKTILANLGFIEISSKYKNPRSNNVITFYLKKVKAS